MPPIANMRSDRGATRNRLSMPIMKRMTPSATSFHLPVLISRWATVGLSIKGFPQYGQVLMSLGMLVKSLPQFGHCVILFMLVPQ